MFQPDTSRLLEDLVRPLPLDFCKVYFGGKVIISGGWNGEEGLVGFHGVSYYDLRQNPRNYVGVVEVSHHHGTIKGP